MKNLFTRNLFAFTLLFISITLGKAQTPSCPTIAPNDFYIDCYNGMTVNLATKGCKGYFLPSRNCAGPGGYAGYCNSENYTMTFYSGSPTTQVRVNFLNLFNAGYPASNTLCFASENNYDFLRVYDGPTIASPQIGNLTGLLNGQFSFTSTSNYLTFRFTSDNIINDWGWFAIVGCTQQACGSNLPAGDECSTATQICDFNGYCGSTSGWYTETAVHANIEAATLGTGCFNGSIENDSWIKFVANSTNVSLSITSSNCLDNLSGIQAVLLSSANCSNFTCVSTTQAQNMGPGTFILNNNVALTIGQTYYLMIDGYAGNMCDYTVQAQSGIAVPTISASAATICQNNTATLSILNSPPSPTYAWSASPAGLNFSTTTAGTTVVTGVSPGTYTVSCVVSGSAGCVNETVTQVVTVTALPTLSAVSSQTVCANSSVSAINYTITPTGSVSWTNNNTSIGLGASGSGNIASFTAANVASTQVATITATPTNAGCPGTPITFSITVNPRPTLTAVSSQTVCAGATVNASNFTSTPGGASVSWTNNNTAIGVAASGSGNIGSYTAPSVGSQQVGTITATPTLNGCPGTPINFNITINPLPTLSSVTSQTVCSGNTVSAIGFSSSPGGATVNWTNNNTAVGIGASGSGNIGSYTAPTVGSTQTGTITATPTLNGCIGSPINFQITINPRPTLSSVSNQTVCAGATVNAINFSSTPGGATVGWTNTNTSIGLNASGSGNIGSYTAPSVGSVQTGIVSATPTLNGCAGTPLNFTITINPTPTLSSVASQSVCAGQPVSGVVFNSSPGGAFVTWTNNNTNIGLGAGGSGNISGYTAPSVGTTQTGVISATPSLNGCNGTAQQFTITINPLPTLFSVPSQTVCSGSSVNTVNFTTNPLGGNVSWTNTNTNIGIGASGTGNINGYTAPVVVTQQVGTITATPTNPANGCVGTPQTFGITINPLPQLNSIAGQTVCGGQTVNAINFVSTPAGATVSWANSNTGIGIGATGTGNISSYTAPSVITQQIGSISATPSLNGCTGSQINFNITVNPTPTLTAVSSQTVCAGQPVNGVSYSTTPAGATINWTNTNTNIGLGASGTGNISGYTSPNVATTQTGIISATPQLGTCNGPASNFTITVNPLPIVSAGNVVLDSADCGQTNGSITGITATGTNPLSYSWNGGPPQGSPNLINIGSGTYNLVVTDGNGCTANSGPYNIFAVGGPNTPLVSSSSTPCYDGSVTLSVTNIQGGVTYTWTGPNGFNVSGPSATIPNVNGTTAGSYTVTASSGSGAGSCSNSNSQTVTFNPQPVAGITGNGLTSFCTGDSLNLIASPTGGFTYQWLNGGSPISGATNSTLYVSITGTYSVIVTNSTTGCSDTAQFVATQNPAPVINASGVSVTPSSCTQPTGVISGATVSGNAPFTFNWYNSSNVLISSSTTTDSLANISAGTYSLVVIDANGCKDTIGPVTMTNSNAPNQPIALSPAAYCSGQTINALSAVGSGGTITWYSDAGLTNQIGTGSIFTPNPAPTITTTYYVTETQNGCQSNATAVTITINPAPNAPTANGASYCSNQTVGAVTASGSSGTYVWYSDAGLTNVLATGANFIPSPTPTNTTTYYVTVTSGGCTSAATPVTITINQAPQVTGSPVIDTAACGLTNGGISGITVTGGTPAYTYNWVNTATGSTVGTSPNLTGVGAGNYSLTVTDVNGCSATGLAGVFTVPSTPGVVAAITPTTASGNVPFTVTFNNNSTGASNYQWNFGNGTSTNTQNATITYTNIGTYTVTMIASNGGCLDTVTAVIVVDVESWINIPNIFSPNGDGINDEFLIFSNGIRDLNCDIFNRWGEKVYTLYSPKQMWDGKMFNGSQASEGTYYYILKAKGYDGKEYDKQGPLTLVK